MSIPTDNNRRHQTRHFRHRPDAAPMEPRQTDSLDLKLPTHIRFILGDMDAVLDVPMNQYIVVGRKETINDRQVDVDFGPFDAHHLGVSRYHAIIQINNDRISIKDFNSSNGTYLNGFSLKPMYGYRLRHGDEIMLGRMKLQVQFVRIPTY